MRKKLAKKPQIAEYSTSISILAITIFLSLKSPSSLHGIFYYCTVVPAFGVGCRRLTPGPGFLESLCEDNVSVYNCTHIL